MRAGDGVADREAVRGAALRLLLRELATADDSALAPPDEQAGRLVLAGYGVRDLCAALAVDPDTARTILMKLAR